MRLWARRTVVVVCGVVVELEFYRWQNWLAVAALGSAAADWSRRPRRMPACGETQLEYTIRRWSGPPLGLQPQNAGQSAGQG